MPKDTKKKRKNKVVRSKNPTKRGRVDWNEAFRWYCTKKEDGFMPSLRDVAIQFGVNIKTVEVHAVKDEWVINRQKAGEKFQEKMKDIAIHYQFQQYEDLTLLEDLTNDAIQIFKDAMNSYRKANSTEEKILALKLIKNITNDILNLSNSLKITQNQKRVLLGMATEISKQDINQTNKNVMLSKEQVKEIDTFIEQNTHVTAKNTNTN
jgi:hypothetical protein